MTVASPAAEQYLLDFSLALVNKTGAYIICRDLLQELPEFFPEVRYWRMIRQSTPTGLMRRIAGRSMMIELSKAGALSLPDWPDGTPSPGRRRLILDPLYVLRSKLERDDIVLCHDIGPVTHPDLFGTTIHSLYERAYQKIATVGPGMVFVSDATQTVFRACYGENFRFFQTIAQYVRLGVLDGPTAPIEHVQPPFLLTVGALELRKNHLRVIEAYAQSKLHERGIGYVFCGARGIGADEILAKAAQTPGVTSLGFVDEAQLRWLYGNGVGFVLPSLLEGFGLPPIEAAQRALVSMVSRGGAQEEAIGGAAVLVDPEDVSSIRDGLMRLVEMPDGEREAIIERAKRRGKVLTYDRYIAGFRRVLENNSGFPGSDGWAASDPEERLVEA
jgi:glycosyltransferase involved in cell wall biosynthesis